MAREIRSLALFSGTPFPPPPHYIISRLTRKFNYREYNVGKTCHPELDSGSPFDQTQIQMLVETRQRLNQVQHDGNHRG